MPLIGNVGKRRARARLAMGWVYLALLLGAITTLYPFVLMASTGLKGSTDQNDTRLIPTFFSSIDPAKDDPMSLYGKYIDDKNAGNKSWIEGTRTGSADAKTISKWRRFLESLPNEYWVPGFKTPSNQVTGKLVAMYQGWLKEKYGSVEKINSVYLEENAAILTVAVPTESPEKKFWKPQDTPKWRDWQDFKSQLPADFRIPITHTRLFQEFLRAKYEGQVGRVPANVLKGAKTFETIPMPASGALVKQFKADRLSEIFQQKSVEQMWASLDPGPMPIEAFEHQFVFNHASEIQSEFATRNYRYVLSYMILNGRGLVNTGIYCLLVILAQLTVNPLAAYALSRYPIRASGRILIFLLATMAFPAEVAMIPSFLLLKQLGLLNTFAALVLPAAASGYMIFLLKGFFDSLPQELYDSGQIDGAKETTMLWRIALPLSRPVLGYLALLAFMGAYGSFLYAFLVVQDRRMWTLMVFIYQLQLSAPKAVMMAALTLAAVPTLLVFLLAQRVIMRGIVLPGER